MKRKILICLLAMGLIAATSGHLPAADYPKKPVKLIINFSAGGTTDVASRLMISKAAMPVTSILAMAIVKLSCVGLLWELCHNDSVKIRAGSASTDVFNDCQE